MDALEARLEAIVERVVRRVLGERPAPPAPELLSTVQAAELADRDPATVRSWIESGELPATKRGRSWVIRRVDLQTYLAGRGADANSACDVVIARILGRKAG